MALPLRDRLRPHVHDARFAARLIGLPPRVVWFQVRARRLARRTGDTFSLTSATRPPDLRTLLAQARGRRSVVEVGTATGWTAISLALADRRRRVLTCDVAQRPEPERYLSLVDAGTRARVEMAIRAGADGPLDGRPVDLLYIDSSHGRAETIDEVLAWRPALAPGAVVVFDDYTHELFGGVREAVAELGLSGRAVGTLFVHRCPQGP